MSTRVKQNIIRTGIDILDRTIGGGIPSGSVVYFSADPRSMSEIFLYQFTQAKSKDGKLRKTYYFATERRPEYIKNDILNLDFDVSNIIFVDIYREYYLTPTGEMIDSVGNEYADTKILEFVENELKVIQIEGKSVNIIMDTWSFFMNLNVNIGMIKRLLKIIYETTKEINGVTYLYALKRTHKENIENEIINACDVIFDVELERSSDKIASKLSIPKIRGMVPSAEMIKFKVGYGVQIDTSRDIA